MTETPHSNICNVSADQSWGELYIKISVKLWTPFRRCPLPLVYDAEGLKAVQIVGEISDQGAGLAASASDPIMAFTVPAAFYQDSGTDSPCT